MTAITIELTDDVGTNVLPTLNVPLTEAPIEGTTDIVTLDNNMSTYFTFKKRLWSHTWSYMTEDDFNILKGYYDRQFTLYQYPLLSIDYLSVSDIPVRMTLSPRSIIDNCGTVQDVEVTFRESAQMPVWSS
jgi:hypothetical protein